MNKSVQNLHSKGKARNAEPQEEHYEGTLDVTQGESLRPLGHLHRIQLLILLLFTAFHLNFEEQLRHPVLVQSRLKDTTSITKLCKTTSIHTITH